MDEANRTANHESLAWLDYALRWSKSGNKTKLAGLLESVRSEVVFEMELAAAAGSSERRQTG
ncbi:MAG: hypothetical protein H0V75_15920 [Rubrobacter sp.]|nr:hypothetical protein [Rubrobacter sp.]